MRMAVRARACPLPHTFLVTRPEAAVVSQTLDSCEETPGGVGQGTIVGLVPVSPGTQE